jgi:hypothetical protein
MCCATSKRRAHSKSSDDSCTSLSGADFYASLLDGMHALAQPITVLHSYFYLAQPSGAGNPGQRQLIADGTSAIEHLCTLFRLMQELVHVQSSEAHLSEVPLSSLIGSLAEDAEVVFAGTGLQLDVQHDPDVGLSSSAFTFSGLVAVQVDPKRTRHAMRSMLHIVRECSQRNSVVRCSLSGEHGWLSLGIAPQTPVEAAPEDCFDEGARLHLALAKANILGQQAIFSLTTQPFALSIRLPMAESVAWPDASLKPSADAGTPK